MTRRASPRLTTHAALCALGLVGALASRRPELVALAAPFALVLALAATADRPPRVRAWLSVGKERALEGDDLDVELTVRADSRAERIDALLVLPSGLAVDEGANPTALRLREGDEQAVPLRLRCVRWGSYRLGDVWLRVRDPLALFTWEWRVRRPHQLRVYPRPEAVRSLVAPLRTQAAVGSEVARAKGDGLELADLRPFVPGDRLRSVNWRASARRGELIVNERHPERNADVVLFLDTFVEARHADGIGASSLDWTVRATASLAAHYLERRDRVGLVSLGGTLRWLEPGSGSQQRYRLIDAVLETEVEFTYAWKDVNIIPARTLPPRALVIAITPLLDRRATNALLDLRARGHDLVVVEVSPLGLVTPGTSEDDRLAWRLWCLRRDELVSRFESLGVAVARWRGGAEPLGARIEGVRAFRRHAVLARR
jgi:uncharacterized protein (DUF58 family)